MDEVHGSARGWLATMRGCGALGAIVRAALSAVVLGVVLVAFPGVALASFSFVPTDAGVVLVRSADDTSGVSPDVRVYSSYEGGVSPVVSHDPWDTSSYGVVSGVVPGSAVAGGVLVPVSSDGVSLVVLVGTPLRFLSCRSAAVAVVRVEGGVTASLAPGAVVSVGDPVALSSSDRETFDVLAAAAVLSCLAVFVLAGYRLSRGT